MEKRSRPRLTRRLTCQIETANHLVAGFVRDVSQSGLFVQTSATPTPNSVVNLVFPATGNQPEVRIEAGVARKRDIARRLQPSVPSGIGLEILPPRGDFERWVYGPARPALSGSLSTTHYVYLKDDLKREMEPARVIRAYRFRLIRHDRSGSQVLTIRCESEAGARARALVRAGAGWKIADAQAL